ncbi:hypothetical protein, partial [Stutzerimonas nitrititolerans]|uniref:hypothetical protein n=1 Tax=Stutzerimonas nitrititolerans TaxID=2482751 RepID=UPI0028AE8D06
INVSTESAGYLLCCAIESTTQSMVAIIFQASHRYPDIPPDEKKPGISRAKKGKRSLDRAYMPSQFGSASEIAGI